MSDKITINTHLSRIDSIGAEVEAEPFRVGVGASKFITFPPINDLPFEDADTILTQIEAAQAEHIPSFSALFRAWLSDEDYKLLMSAQPTFGQMTGLFKALMDAYQEQVGTPGEGPSSASA